MSRKRWLKTAPGTDPVQLRSLSPADADAIAADAGRRGYVCVRVELAGCVEKQEFLARIATGLRFPDWFGHNWDAFFDCLADLSWWPAPGHVLVLMDATELQRDAP